MAWVLALGITGGLLLALFSLTASEFLAGRWPLGIGAVEVEQYAGRLDLRRGTPAQTGLESFVLNCGAGCPDGSPGANWTACWFQAGEHADSAEVRALPGVTGAVELRFPMGRPFRDQQRIALHPADEASIRDKYLQVLAEEIGMLTPEVSFVRLSLCGTERGLFRRSSVVDASFLAKHGMLDGIAYTQSFDPARPDLNSPLVDADPARAALVRSTLARSCADLRSDRMDALMERVDQDAVIAWMLMLLVEGEEDPLYREHAFAFRESTGRIVPIYTLGNGGPEVSVGGSPPWACNPFTPLLSGASFTKALNARCATLIEESWRIRERFAGIDRSWLPLLQNGGSQELAKARAKRIQEELLGRLRTGRESTSLLARAIVPAPLDASALTASVVVPTMPEGDDRHVEARALAKRYRMQVQGDTLFLPRGKYAFEEDVLMPHGYAVVLLPGARIEIAPGRNVLVRGSLFARGTRINPVFIRPLREGAHYGTFAAVGNGEDRVRLSGVRISGGAGGTVDRTAHTAMLSLRGMSVVEITICSLEGDGSADVLHVEGGRSKLVATAISNGRAVLRNVQGAIEEVAFTGDARRGGKGGMVVSGGRLVLDQVSFTGMTAAGLHADAAAQLLVTNGSFERCGVAISVHDLATLHIADNRIANNGIALQLRRVAPAPAGGQVYMYPNVLQGNAKDEDVDQGSRIEVRPALDPALRTAFGR